jgi:hypothetical protein
MKKFNEWARDNDFQLDTLGDAQDMGMETLYDEDLITQQVNDWLNKLTGLCSPVPTEDRPELVEQIVKAIRQQLL